MEDCRAVADLWAVQLYWILAGWEADAFRWRCIASVDFDWIGVLSALFLPLSLSDGRYLQPDIPLGSFEDCKTAE